jgi:hypothetical protein
MRSFVCLAALLLTGANSALACPLCPTDLGLTVSEEIAGADIALIVEWVAATPADVEAGLPGETEYQVAHVLRDTTQTVQAGDAIKVPRHRAATKDDRFLLLGAADGMLRWSSPLPVGDSAEEYVRRAPRPDADRLERLRFFARRMEHADAFIAADAFAEFALAKYEDVVAAAGEFEPDRLRRWLTDSETLPTRRGLYSLLLGLRGDAGDAEFLKERILSPADDFRLGLDGMIAGYLLLTGEDGLEVIEDSKLRDRDVNFSETYGAMQSLRFMWSYTDGVISKERLRSAMRILLDRPELADLVITDLARWQDWSIVDRLMELYGAEEYNIPSIQRAVVRYYLVAERSEGEHVGRARKHLEQLRESDPETVKQAERLFLLY